MIWFDPNNSNVNKNNVCSSDDGSDLGIGDTCLSIYESTTFIDELYNPKYKEDNGNHDDFLSR